MIPVDQTIFVNDPDGRIGNCWPAAVASAFDLPLFHIPHFWQEAFDAGEDDEGWARYHRFLASIGRRMEYRGGLDIEWPAPVDCVIFGVGPSPRGVQHMVVLDRFGQLAHDPHPSRAGLTTLDYIEVVTMDPRPVDARGTYEPWLDSFWPKAADRAPRRVQMSRQHPWRSDNPDAVRVDRTTKWGNPFRLGDKQHGLVHYGPKHLQRFGREWDYEGRISAPGMEHTMWFAPDDIVETHVRLGTAAEIVELYRLTILDPTPGMLLAYPSARGHFLKVTVEDIRTELAGRDLACWCPPGQPCHADVLLELANGTKP